jgi:aminoglycoside 3-N-acetyltransferase
MITYRELVTSFRTLDVGQDIPVIVHASLSGFGDVNGGMDTLLGALLNSFDSLLMPVFTQRTMVIPEVGPAENGINYGSGRVSNSSAEFFRADLPADTSMGVLAEGLRRLPQAHRSSHPILSFAGVNMEADLASQTLSAPLAPLQSLLASGGWVLMMGVDQTANVSLHLAEKLAGRKQFIRWALTSGGVIECPNIPGCPQGFNAITPRLRSVTRQVPIGETIIQAIPLADLVSIARAWLDADPLALLCDRKDCALCQAVRARVVKV